MAEDLAFLIYRTGLGDQRAFEKLYKDSSPRLYALAMILLRRKDQAEDALQDAFVSVWNSASTYNPDKGTPQTWLNVIVRHRCIDRLRREPQRTTTLDDEGWAVFEASGPTPLQELLSDADARLLAGCLEHLDSKQKESVALAFFHGLTHSELAAHLSAPLGSVKAWVRRGLERLRGCLHHEI
jgi:RNA polymerase sigma-70 factor (ECF subfamily)